MEIEKELIANEIGKIAVDFLLEKEIDYNLIVQTAALEVLGKIKKIIQNDSLDDFLALEYITTLLAEYGIESGARHDFG